MRDKLILIILLLILTFMFSSCKSNSSTSVISKDIKYYSPYTGEEMDESDYYKIPFFAIIENSKDARPQSGLSYSDIVFETMAEGGIPRFIALFYKNSPKVIGPIRSVRPYFIDIANEYSLPFAHCGGSLEALNIISKNKLMSLNEMNNGSSFWRDTSRKAPHNLYASADALRKLIKDKDYSKMPKSWMNFNNTFWENGAFPSAEEITLNLNKFYSTNYIYKNGYYYKYMDGIQMLDKETNKPITTKNIVIQISKITLQEDKTHLSINLTGEGKGYIISCGKYIKVKWSKLNYGSPTILKDEDGNTVSLSKGNTWWHIIDQKNNIIINNIKGDKNEK